MKIRWLTVACAVSATLHLNACSTGVETARAILGGTAVGGITPTGGLEQIYYLGVYDPREQIPQGFYRITVKGQTSFINLQTRFSSGWVPAALIDGLGTDIDARLNPGRVVAEGAETTVPELNDPVKRMYMIGPEGIRVSPANHRLAIVMGSSPEKFFAAVDQALGTLSTVEVTAANAKVKDALNVEHRRLQDEHAAIQKMRLDLSNAALKRATGGDQ